ncbi:MAG: ribonuclease P protein component [Acidobacteria bacterium]|nr:ribonuclease P protein component [Acidobacteriota bacterium]MXZ72279.1 ribonuclease P protein component [Acidobacteriota bacterium]MYD71206.1 ribonuclease P protein component [Acidobacteriota bacterium]MYJ03900.1 ribonuclease P protein component [Acidobacteriota bacterium]
MDRTLTYRERIRRRPDFLIVQQRGRRTRGRFLTVFSRANGLDRNRLGIIATRRLGGAVRRNRAKRLMREVFRHCKGQGGLDIVALLRPGFDEVAYSEIDADYRATLERITRHRS